MGSKGKNKGIIAGGHHMNKKYPSLITKIKVNRASFHNEPIEKLSFINFFYGNNGAGKSSIAYAIGENNGDNDSVEWLEGRSPNDYDVLVYNRDFIKYNFSNYGDLPGVFIFNKINKDVQSQIDKKRKEKDKLNDSFMKAQEDWHTKKNGVGALLTTFQDECFKKTVKERSALDKALEGKKQKRGFVEAILSETNPTNYKVEDLKQLCDVAFDTKSRAYSEFQKVDTSTTYGKLPGENLLATVVVSSANTDFAKFVRKIKATDWLRQGHAHFVSGSEGKCPFCQQKLPDTFEEEIQKCFDSQYQENVSEICKFQNTYDKETRKIVQNLEANIRDLMPGLDAELEEYKSKLNLLKSKIEINSRRLAEKVKEPSKIISLEETDSLMLEIGDIIDAVNKKIKANNEVVNAKRTSKIKCKKEAIEFFAFLLKDDIMDYLAEKKKQEEAVKKLEDEGRKLKKSIRELTAEIAALNLQVVNTQAAVDGINKILKDSGFQGFHIRECESIKNHYEVIRDTGEVAENLSEGERNFIAFLYFYQLVRGSQNSKEKKDKIVVIDDPVSSMDSNSLFLVSAIIREMINVCRNNTEWKNPKVPGYYIKQIFILTHNVYFHREITTQQVGYYDCTTFYIIRKISNISRVHICERPKSDAKTELENYNPVQSSYAALWEELRNADTVIPALNIMRRILETYFLQLCGYEGISLREQLLEDSENRKNFIKEIPGGEPDMTDYELASTMLAYINNPNGITDGLNLVVEDYDDVNLYKRVFKQIFYVMRQNQHYDMMTAAIKKKS